MKDLIAVSEIEKILLKYLNPIFLDSNYEIIDSSEQIDPDHPHAAGGKHYVVAARRVQQEHHSWTSTRVSPPLGAGGVCSHDDAKLLPGRHASRRVQLHRSLPGCR